MKLIVRPDSDGAELITVLHGLKISRAELIRMKKRPDGILLNGEHATVRSVVHTSDVIELSREDRQEEIHSSIVPVDLPVEVIYEDELIIAFNKPPGMPTHPGHAHQNDTLANAAAYRAELSKFPFVFRPVNRLDRDTSGIVLTAKSKSAAYVMSEIIESGNIKKDYFCLLEGKLPFGSRFTVRKNIKRKLPSVIERTVCPENEGQYAETEYEVIGCDGGICSCIARPRTGRTHQIRVHAASVGMPVLGDSLYGHSSPLIGRQALHCAEIEYQICVDGCKRFVSIHAPIPDDIKHAAIIKNE